MKPNLLADPITALPLSALPGFVTVEALETLRLAALKASNRTKTSHLRTLEAEIADHRKADEAFFLFSAYYFSRKDSRPLFGLLRR